MSSKVGYLISSITLSSRSSSSNDLLKRLSSKGKEPILTRLSIYK